ncbi:hypothetical protein EK904_003342, partial [Melospiza melodia maxima]
MYDWRLQLVWEGSSAAGQVSECCRQWVLQELQAVSAVPAQPPAQQSCPFPAATCPGARAGLRPPRECSASLSTASSPCRAGLWDETELQTLSSSLELSSCPWDTAERKGADSLWHALSYASVPSLQEGCKFLEEELATEPLKYAEQLPVAQIIHQAQQKLQHLQKNPKAKNKPKQKDWHPPGGFILGLWALIIMVFFKTYGIKHMKH